MKMEGDTRQTSTAAAPDQAQPGGAFARLARGGAGTRRQLLKAGLVGVPVIVTLASRPAFGAINFSAGTSANLTSGNVQTQGFAGRNATYWAGNPSSWPGGYSPSTKFSDAFGHVFPVNGSAGTGVTDPSGIDTVKAGDLTLLQVLMGNDPPKTGSLNDPSGVGALAVAALLDGSDSTPANPFPLSSHGVTTIFDRGYGDLYDQWADIATFFKNIVAH